MQVNPLEPAITRSRTLLCLPSLFSTLLQIQAEVVVKSSSITAFSGEDQPLNSSLLPLTAVTWFALLHLPYYLLISPRQRGHRTRTAQCLCSYRVAPPACGCTAGPRWIEGSACEG